MSSWNSNTKAGNSSVWKPSQNTLFKTPEIEKFNEFQKKWLLDMTPEQIKQQLETNVCFFHDRYTCFVKEIIWALRHSFKSYPKVLTVCYYLSKNFQNWDTITEKVFELCNHKELEWFVVNGIFESFDEIVDDGYVDGWTKNSIGFALKTDDLQLLVSFGTEIPEFIMWSDNEIIENPFKNDLLIKTINVALLFCSQKCINYLLGMGHLFDAQSFIINPRVFNGNKVFDANKNKANLFAIEWRILENITEKPDFNHDLLQLMHEYFYLDFISVYFGNCPNVIDSNSGTNGNQSCNSKCSGSTNNCGWGNSSSTGGWGSNSSKCGWGSSSSTGGWGANKAVPFFITYFFSEPFEYSYMLFIHEIAFCYNYQNLPIEDHLKSITQFGEYQSLNFLLTYSHNAILKSTINNIDYILNIKQSVFTGLKELCYNLISTNPNYETIQQIINYDLLSVLRIIFKNNPPLLDNIHEYVELPWDGYRIHNYFARLEISRIKIRFPCDFLLSSIIINNIRSINSLMIHGLNVDCFLHAFANDDLHIISYFLSRGFSINDHDGKGWCPIHIACHFGKLENISFILENGGDINSKTSDSITPLHLVSQWASPQIYEDLICFGAIEEVSEYSPLIVSIESSNYSLFKHLISKKIFKIGQYLNELIRYSIISNDKEILSSLLEFEDIKYDQNFLQSMMSLAESRNLHDIMICIIETGVDLDFVFPNWSVLLRKFVLSQNVQMVKILLSNNRNMLCSSPNGQSVLIDAVSINNNEIFELLLKSKFSINIKDENGLSCLHWAVLNNSQTMVETLIINGININGQDNNGNCALFYAISNGNIEIFLLLLNYGISCELKNNMNETPIYEAFRRNQRNIVIELINQGVNIMPIPNSEKSLLHYAVEQNDLELASEFIKRKIPINSKTLSNKDTPMHIACRKDSIEMIYLIHKTPGSSMNDQNKLGETPLFLASQHSTPQIVEYLLKNGANPELKDNSNRTPLSVAQNPKIKLLLQMHQKK